MDSLGAPINGNHLKGEATIVNRRRQGDASKYNAVGVFGLNTDLNSNNSDNVLCLGGGVSPSCPNGAEYNACPQTVILNHFAENASDPVIDALGNGLVAGDDRADAGAVHGGFRESSRRHRSWCSF